MGGGPETAVSVGRTVRKNGIEVVAIIQQPEPDPYAHIVPGSTAKHEAKHIMVAKRRGVGVKGATIVPNMSAGYLGATFVDSFDGPAFMAAHADGHGGTGHDRAVTIFMGRNPDSDASVARGILDENREETNILAAALQQQGSMGRRDIDRVLHYAFKKKNEEPKATVIIKTEKGEQDKIENAKVKNGIVIFDSTLLKKKEIPINRNDYELAG